VIQVGGWGVPFLFDPEQVASEFARMPHLAKRLGSPRSEGVAATAFRRARKSPRHVYRLVPVEPAGYDELGAVDVAVLLKQRARGVARKPPSSSCRTRGGRHRSESHVSLAGQAYPPASAEHGSHSPRAAFPSNRLSGPGIVDPD
jgi:hypothetical protein